MPIAVDIGLARLLPSIQEVPQRLVRLDIPKDLRARMRYKKLAGETPRVLLFQCEYWLDRSCLSAARSLGWAVRTARVPAEGAFTRDAFGKLLLTMVEFRPDFILTPNLGGMDEAGILMRLCEDFELPFVTWFVDDPRTIIMERTVYGGPYSVALSWESSYLDSLRRASFAIAAWMPLAADTLIFKPTANPGSGGGAPCFVGNSMAAPAHGEWAWISERPALAGAVRDALDSGRVTRETFAAGLEAVLPPELVARLDPHERRHAELLLFVEGTRRLRSQFAWTLAQEGVVFYGDEGWSELLPAAGHAINYRRQLADVYRLSAVNVNITSIQMARAVNQRVFDCPAAGGFLLTDAQSDLQTLFEPDERASYESIEECRDRLRWYLAHPEERAAIAGRAQRRVHAQHTYAHRLQEIAALIRGHYA